MSLCSIAHGDVKCDEPIASIYEAACVHGHVMPDLGVCAGHEWLVAVLVWTCNQCMDEHGECFVKLTMSNRSDAHP